MSLREIEQKGNGDGDVEQPPNNSFSAGMRISGGDDESFEEGLQGESDTNGSDVSDRNDPHSKSETTNETKLVQYSKMMVLLVLVLAAGGSSSAVYILSARSQRQAFQDSVRSHAEEISDVSQVTANSVFSAIQGISITTTSYAVDQNASWPFITIPHFESRGSQVLEQSGTAYLTFNPIVKSEFRTTWEAFAFENHKKWIPPQYLVKRENSSLPTYIPFLYGYDGNDYYYDSEPTDFYLPIWQIAPVLSVLVNLNYMRTGDVSRTVHESISTRSTSMSKFENLEFNSFPLGRPYTNFFAPVYNELDFKGEIVGFYTAITPWENFFANILPERDTNSMHVVVRNSCGQALTYEVQGSKAEIIAANDTHNPAYDYLEFNTAFKILGSKPNEDSCNFTLSIYPTDKFYSDFAATSQPIIYTLIVLSIFFLTSMVFFLYDCLVQRRQEKTQTSADRSNAIVSSLFPAQVRDRLLEGDARAVEESKSHQKQIMGRGFSGVAINSSSAHNQNKRDPSADLGDGVRLDIFGGKPIADLFSNCTVLFADIAGFTSWSSEREPTAVFQLLETIYNAFDRIAKKRGVFKVETIGDCYVATTGLPEPRPDHAEAMAKFANETRIRMNVVVERLEVVLGPGTSDLAMRYGLHSGPVTAGVLRGEKSRFQLFGDTVNTASRIESSGERDRIHLSESTAHILIAAGRSTWVTKRDGLISAKGKGELQTYWLELPRSPSASGLSQSTHSRMTFSDDDMSVESLRLKKMTEGENMSTSEIQKFQESINMCHDVDTCVIDSTGNTASNKTDRLVQWNVEILTGHLKQVLAMRNGSQSKPTSKKAADLCIPYQTGRNVIDEVLEIIPLPTKAHEWHVDPESVVLSPIIKDQLYRFVSTIASLYRDNAFHSFDHASHVLQSVSKLMARVVTEDNIDYNSMQYVKTKCKSSQHSYTFGITSDPLLQFSCAFAALIHDVDHTGLPNSQLVKEQTDLAAMYRNKSVAEQNSVDIAWELLMEPAFADLRACIYQTQEELEHFRRVVVNSVMATDIVDTELKQLRNNRWDAAFNTPSESLSTSRHDSETESHWKRSADDVEKIKKDKDGEKLEANRKATIVIEHLIQASDVSHTMQHWHVYIKWNEKLFREMYKAYEAGRAQKNPAEGWYEGELGFFDFYIVPLARKLQECGVFGVASDEYLNYALANRREWQTKGRKIVADFLSRYHEEKIK